MMPYFTQWLLRWSVLFILLFIGSTKAATYCVSTSIQLQSALNSANTNNQNNLIKIVQGIYFTPGSAFTYNLGGGKPPGRNLEISGGWWPASGFLPCSQQNPNAFSTVLDGNNSNGVMQIRTENYSKITINNLTFSHGISGAGGGLHVYSLLSNTEFKSFDLDHCAFLNNEATVASALHVSGFDQVSVKNSLFVKNHAVLAATVHLGQGDGYGIFFTNNTVTENTVSDNSLSTAGVNINVSESVLSALFNNILWNNDNSDLNLVGYGTHHLYHNNIGIRTGNALHDDVGNMSIVPDFPFLVSEPYNYTLSLSSPLVNAGMHPSATLPQSWFLGSNDMLGRIRKQDGVVDIGALETTPDLIFMNGFE